MIKRLEKFFCITPLILALLCASFVNGEQVIPPEDSHKEEANDSSDCIKSIRQKQGRIKQEIEMIKKLIKKDRQKDIHQNRPD